LPLTASRYFTPGVKRHAESQAFADLAAPLGSRARRLFAQYQESSTPEARLVKACDKLQLMLKVAAYEAWGTGDLADFWHTPAHFPSFDIAPVDDLIAELERRRTSD